MEKGFRYIPHPPFRPFLAGIFLVIAYFILGTYKYAGLGISVIQNALHNPASFSEPAFKALFTALTISSGFKGGEFIPLVFIGTTLGSALSLVIPLSVSLLAGTGFPAVFGAAANTPISCSIMAVELFGYRIAPFAFIACMVSYYVSGNKSIYKTQPVYSKKHPAFFWQKKAPEKSRAEVSQRIKTVI
jgi:H+/Cl- antiporter ClcA